MKKSFMTRVLAVSLSAAMAFSMSSASNLMTASAASTVNLKTTFKTLKVNQKYKLTLKTNTLNWKITKVKTTNKNICTVYGKTASSVMLKGKGVGRAKITVKVKTAKRKYPKNIKEMKCTVNVKPADTQTTETFGATATANGNSEVIVKFTQAIDTPDNSNFTVSDNVSVNGVEMSDGNKTATLKLAGAEYDKEYSLTVTGVKVAGKEQAEQKLTFRTPAATEEYPVTLVPEKPLLKSDGSTSTVVKFTIKDKNGNLIKDEGVEVLFTASIGKFAEQRVTVENGEATNMYTSAALMETTKAELTATVVESTANQKLLGRSAGATITLSPNGEDGNTAIGAIITSVTAPTADRVYAYFNQPVNASDFWNEKTKTLNKNKFTCTIYSGLDNNSKSDDYTAAEKTGSTAKIKKADVIGVLPVDEDPTALQLLVDEPMIDNTNVEVKFENKLNSDSLVPATNTVYTKLTDVRQPSALNVTDDGKRKITVEFSEAVLVMQHAIKYSRAEQVYAADNPENYKIDGRPLSYYNITRENIDVEAPDTSNSEIQKVSTKDAEPGSIADSATIKIGSYNKAEDNRHKVTIKLGQDAISRLAAGQQHSLEISNVGDWAALTDGQRNIMNTQTLHFTINENNDLPLFTVEPESPEQYKVVFNNDFYLTDSNDTVKTPNSVATPSILELQQKEGNSWKTISDGDGSGKNPIRVSKINGTDEPNAYMVEVNKDWTEVYNTRNTRINYYNHQLRLHIDAGRICNAANYKVNEELGVELNQDIMRDIDSVSPSIESVDPAENKNGEQLNSYNVTLSEPVKMSDAANKEGLTPSQTQKLASNADTEKNMGVPAPSAQFVSEDGSRTVDAYITSDEFMDASDKVINIEPVKALEPGIWRVVVSSISDDYGNTAPTSVKTIEVQGQPSNTDFKILWAAVGTGKINSDGTINEQDRTYEPNAVFNPTGLRNGRYIFVKFNKPINLVGHSTNALVSANYTIDGGTAPTGTNIYAKIKGYDDEVPGIVDSITIELPRSTTYGSGTEYYRVSTLNTILNVSKAITSTTGETLSGATNIRLPYNWGDAANVSSLKTKTDAVWGNDPDEQIGSGADAVKEYYKNLKAALENDQYRKVILTYPLNLTDNDAKEVFGKNYTLTIKRAVDVELRADITGNVEVATSDVVNDITFSSDNGSRKITGMKANPLSTGTATLTVDTVNAGFVNNGVTIEANENDMAIKINDVCVGTYTNNGIVKGDITIADSNGTGFENLGTVEGGLIINTNGELFLKGNFADIDNGILVNDVAKVDFAGADLRNAKIVVTASNARIIIRSTTQVTGAVITAEAKDVRITLPKDKDGITFVKGNNEGSFKAVTAANRDVVNNSDDAVTLDSIAPVASKLAEALSKLDVCKGLIADSPVGNSVTVTRGAISGSALLSVSNIEALVGEYVASETGYNNKDTDGIEFVLKVEYELVTRNAFQKASNGKDIELKPEGSRSHGSDSIKLTIKVEKLGKEVSEIVRRITVDEK